MNLGENIYRLRTEKNLSQGDLADALEVSRQSVSKWENNSAVPELDKLLKLAQIFGITIDELVTGTQHTPTPPPPPPTPATVHQRLSTQTILGIILLALGGLGLIIFFRVRSTHRGVDFGTNRHCPVPALWHYLSALQTKRRALVRLEHFPAAMAGLLCIYGQRF